MRFSTASWATWLQTSSCFASWLDSACRVRGVNYSPALKWPLLVLLVALTLGLKWTGHAREPNEKDAQLRVAEFLVRQRFTVVRSAEAKEGEPTVRATAPACRMLVIKSPVVGWDRDTIRRHATAAD